MIRLLCVGLGGMGRHDWSQAAAVRDFRLVAGVDVDPQARSHFATETKAPTFANLDEALGRVPADAALIATPDPYHAPFSIRALRAGLDVICEKPMAENLADARRMHATAEKAGRMLMIHHQLRWAPTHYHARRLIRKGAIGRVRHLEFQMSVFSNACRVGYRSRLPQLMLQDLGIHHFDLIRYYAGEECRSIYARSWKSNEEGVDIPATTNVYAIVEMTGPVTACYSSKMRAILDPTGYGCAAMITGSRGVLKATDGELWLQTYEHHAAGKAPRKIRAGTPKPGTWQAIARAIKTREPTLTASADNLRSLEMLFAAIRSVETGRLIRLGPAD